MIVCGTRDTNLSAVVEFHIVLFLSHDIVLGFDWLHTCNPPIDWWACTLLVKVPGGHHILAGLPCESIVHIELTALDSVCKEVDHGAAAWFIPVHLVEPPDAMGACNTLASGVSGDD